MKWILVYIWFNGFGTYKDSEIYEFKTKDACEDVIKQLKTDRPNATLFCKEEE